MRWMGALMVFAVGCGSSGPELEFTAVTFNTGTSTGLGHDVVPPDDGYTEADSEIVDEHYGNGLSVPSFIADTRAYLDELQPDIIAFQEIFHPGDCAMIPTEFHAGFVCETWADGDDTVAQMVLGEGYQVACNPGNPDKCLAVRTGFGSFRGCSDDLCLEGLDGATIDGCSSGSRVARGVVELADGGTLTVVNVHGSSGLTRDEQTCRGRQFDAAFVDLDGAPAASGEANVVLGDFNTDPVRFSGSDTSADRLAELVNDGSQFRFVSDVGMDAEPTYAGLFNIDHVISDAFTGSCFAAGLSLEHPPVTDGIFFDHRPIVCALGGDRPAP